MGIVRLGGRTIPFLQQKGSNYLTVSKIHGTTITLYVKKLTKGLGSSCWMNEDFPLPGFIMYQFHGGRSHVSTIFAKITIFDGSVKLSASKY
jgi:hypothetical protein